MQKEFLTYWLVKLYGAHTHTCYGCISFLFIYFWNTVLDRRYGADETSADLRNFGTFDQDMLQWCYSQTTSRSNNVSVGSWTDESQNSHPCLHCPLDRSCTSISAALALSISTASWGAYNRREQSKKSTINAHQTYLVFTCARFRKQGPFQPLSILVCPNSCSVLFSE